MSRRVPTVSKRKVKEEVIGGGGGCGGGGGGDCVHKVYKRLHNVVVAVVAVYIKCT